MGKSANQKKSCLDDLDTCSFSGLRIKPKKTACEKLNYRLEYLPLEALVGRKIQSAATLFIGVLKNQVIIVL